MKQYRISRKVASIPIVAGGFATIDLPRGYDYESLFIRINASLNVSVGATSVRAEAPCQLVQRVEIIADGKNNLFSAPFWYASLGNFNRSGIETGARATVPPTAATAATYAVEASACIDFMTVDGARPKDSNFRSSGLSLFQARLTFGAASDCFVGGTVAFSGSPTVDVFTQEMIELPDAAGETTKPLALKKVSYQEIAISATNANQEIRLPAGNLIRSVLFRTEGNTTAGEPQIGTLNNLTLQSGVDVRMNLTSSQVRTKNNFDYGQITTGYYVADVSARGNSDVNLSELWDVTNQAEPKAIVDVTAGTAAKIQAVVTEYILAGA